MPLLTDRLLAGLVDDAAVFPPGNASLPAAVLGHGRHREQWYAACVGPLLVPAAAARDLLPLVSTPLDAALIVRPGGDSGTLSAALDVLAGSPVHVVGLEIGWSPGWEECAGPVPLAVEIPRGEDHRRAITEVHDSHASGVDVHAKFRTGPTPSWAWPDEAELAGFLIAMAAAGTPFKLTGGLHHAARGAYEVEGVPEDNHGVLNVLLATHAALDGADIPEVAGLLAVRDGEALAALVGQWTDPTTTRVRQALRSFGCCTVTDPIEELHALGLLDKDA